MADEIPDTATLEGVASDPQGETLEPLTGRHRKRCGARARSRGGAPCQCKVVPGRTRCKLHGGMSTGPKTPEGRARSSEGARRYFAERRAASVAEAAMVASIGRQGMDDTVTS